jgi:apolipoprotein N-acyltransferase
LLALGRPGPEPAEHELEEDEQRRLYSYVAAVLGVLGAAASLLVGWMLPVSLAAIVFGVLGLRREEHGRTPAFVGIGTGIAGLVFSCVWIGYYAIVFEALPR